MSFRGQLLELRRSFNPVAYAVIDKRLTSYAGYEAVFLSVYEDCHTASSIDEPTPIAQCYAHVVEYPPDGGCLVEVYSCTRNCKLFHYGSLLLVDNI